MTVAVAGWRARVSVGRLSSGLGIALLAASAVVLVGVVDTGALTATWTRARADPVGLAVVLAAYAAAFVARAAAWRVTLAGVNPRLSLGHAVAAIHVSLAGNHVLPLRLGEPLRALSVIRRARTPVAAAAASTVALRAADLVAALLLAAVLAPSLLTDLLGPWGWAAVAVIGAAGVVGWRWLGGAVPNALRGRTGGLVAATATGAWVLESAVVWQAAHWAGLTPTWRDALLVAVVSVAVQVIAITPGGFGTYETAAVAAWSVLGVAPGPALAAALAAHLVKTIYALLTGAVAVFVPAPGLTGRLRLPRAITPRPGHDPNPEPPDRAARTLPGHDLAPGQPDSDPPDRAARTLPGRDPAPGQPDPDPPDRAARTLPGHDPAPGQPDPDPPDRAARTLPGRDPAPGQPAPDPPDRAAPVLLFLPAHNEEATVGAVLARAPRSVAGRAVARLVVDDGSTDGTAAAAARAGVEVLTLPRNRGLGAAVRHGLREAHRRGVAAVAFCDADGEYDPAELGWLVEPILEGRADYVLGSRFHGDIRRMLPHRRLGNRVLTRWLAFVARRPISDGQSGYRAFSAAAAADAEVIHDYNYAQVLTLDLLGKGYRYLEVPITYAFRQHGRSFVRLGRYLRHVVPAVHRELNADPAGATAATEATAAVSPPPRGG